MKNTGVGLPGLLFLLLVALKLTGYLTWSWWWVTAPLWGGFVIASAIMVLVLVIGVIAEVAKTKKSKSGS